jgi:hypothetical protein
MLVLSSSQFDSKRKSANPPKIPSSVLTSNGQSKWLKALLFGIWGLLLIPSIGTTLEKWLGENVFSEPNTVATTISNNLAAVNQLRWFKFALVFMTGLVIGASLEALNRKSGERKAFEVRSLGYKFRSLSDSIKTRIESSRWPDSVRLRPCLHLFPPRSLICGCPVSKCTGCRTRHSFVNTSDVSEGS